VIPTVNTSSDGWLAEELLTVFPNPGTGLFHLSLPTDVSGPMDLRVLNQMGQIVRQTPLLLPQSSIWMLDLSDQATGVYHVQLTGARKRYQARLIKQ